ncbi:MAG: 2-C-methyl-D-erythritol 4-phosphate cytidylyltransferase [Bacteroidaceae bacterium]|nr:2-C-methyl-D-erythritol 4-phosphate cytidylyltransferase [Bacteroidaceae bacterium]
MTSTPYCIIVAGGKGLRMGSDLPKQFLPVGGKPLLMHTLEAFERAVAGIHIVLVLPADHQPYWRELCHRYSFTLPHDIATGGPTRFHSVLSGLRQVAAIHGASDGLVAVHDGVRPFVSPEVIRRCFRVAQESGAAVPVVPVVETLRQMASSSSHTVDRSLFRLVQTPQTFQLSLLLRAFEQPYSDAFTDDASVVEALGHPITLVEGNRENIKITTPFDLTIAESLLASSPS